MKDFFIRWINTTVAVLIAAHIVVGIGYAQFTDLIIASLLLGILNAIARPILMLLSLPLLLLTLGLFMLVINAGLLYFVGWLVKGFHVGGFWAAFFGALVISIASMFLNALTGTGKTTVKAKASTNRDQPRPKDDDKGGPIIDV